MAAAVSTNATTIEQQVLEVASQLQAALTTYQAANNGATPTGFSVSRVPNLNAGTVSLTITLPITESVDADGGVSFDATEVLV